MFGQIPPPPPPSQEQLVKQVESNAAMIHRGETGLTKQALDMIIRRLQSPMLDQEELDRIGNIIGERDKSSTKTKPGATQAELLEQAQRTNTELHGPSVVLSTNFATPEPVSQSTFTRPPQKTLDKTKVVKGSQKKIASFEEGKKMLDYFARRYASNPGDFQNDLLLRDDIDNFKNNFNELIIDKQILLVNYLGGMSDRYPLFPSVILSLDKIKNVRDRAEISNAEQALKRANREAIEKPRSRLSFDLGPDQELSLKLLDLISR